MTMVPKIVLVFELRKNKHPSYLFGMIPKALSTGTISNQNNIPLFSFKHEYLRISLFPSIFIEWSKIHNDIGKSKSVSASKKKILIFVRSSPNSTFNVHKPHGIKLLARLRVGLSHSHEHKFRHNFLILTYILHYILYFFRLRTIRPLPFFYLDFSDLH